MVKTRINQLAYALIFVVLIPFSMLWMTQHISVALPAYHLPLIGGVITLLGLVFLLVGMLDLRIKGKGLPMNAYPPKLLVLNGIYAVLPHPIYCGFCLMVIGLSLHAGSSTGLWLMAPLAVLGCMSLVWGYERIFLLNTFRQLPAPWLGLPEHDGLFWRMGAFNALFGAWWVLFETFKWLGAPADAIDLHFTFEYNVPVWVWSYPIYASAYVYVCLPFLLCWLKDLKYFCVIGWLSLIVMSLCYIAIPGVATPRVLPELSGVESALTLFFHQMLQFEMQHAAPYTASFPSYHVVWTVLVALVLRRVNSQWAVVGGLWGVLIIVSCFTTGMHALADLLAGLIVGLLLYYAPFIWQVLIRWCNGLANSYHFTVLGPIRVMSHAKFSFATGFVLVLLASLLLGVAYAKIVVAMGCIGLLGAVLWGWLIEGATVSMRPLGYFGSVLLFLLFNAVLLLAGYHTWVFMAALFTAGPFAHIVGRFRCIVQGCCHGRVLSEKEHAQCFCITIPHSRVVSISQLSHQPIYPTQVYAMLGNLVLGTLLIRLWMLQAEITLIIGLYLVLTGFLRFVEEGYRGEIQTPKYYELASYQWLCLLFIVLGCSVMCLNLGLTAPVIPSVNFSNGVPMIMWALVGGVIGSVVGSVDFPCSNKPFSRLER